MNERDARLLVGQIFARRLPRNLDDLDMGRFPVGNYIVFKDILAGSFEDSAAVLADARRRLQNRGVQPLFMIDEEGGRVTQIAGLFPSAPSASAVARVLPPDQARLLYQRVSELLAALGIDLNLAPCVDVNTEPLNPIIGTRSFGTTRAVVEDYGRAFIAASAANTGCVAKHFPGHGMTDVDSHVGMPTVKASRSDLESVHIPPFINAVRSGACGLMVSHCNYPAIQADVLPASLSFQVIRDLLRRKIDFDGLVMTDSLDMDAVTRETGPVEASMSAFTAGADVLLYTEDSERLDAAFEAMTSNLLAGSLDRSRLAESIARRHLLLDTLPSPRRSEGGETHERFMELRDRVLAASVRIDDPRHLLPIMTGPAACIASDPAFLKTAGGRVEFVDAAARAEDVRGKALILWLMEPLRLRHSIEDLRRMIDLSEVSVLVTSYESLAEMLVTSSVKIIAADTSPYTQEKIATAILEAKPPADR